MAFQQFDMLKFQNQVLLEIIAGYPTPQALIDDICDRLAEAPVSILKVLTLQKAHVKAILESEPKGTQFAVRFCTQIKLKNSAG